MTEPAEAHRVDPARLASGRWSEQFNKTVGEGDIAASYCADTIALRGSTRAPFVFQGDLYVAVSLARGTAEAYRLIPIDDFDGESLEYADRTRDCDKARSDPEGFYHGVAVSYRKDWFVLRGPPVRFAPGEPDQPGLFGQP